MKQLKNYARRFLSLFAAAALLTSFAVMLQAHAEPEILPVMPDGSFGPYAEPIERTVLFAKGDGTEGNIYGTNPLSNPQRTFSSSNTEGNGYSNNLRVEPSGGVDLTGCNAITLNLHLSSQEGYDEWVKQMCFVVGYSVAPDDANATAIPIPADLIVPEGGGVFPVTLDISNFTEVQLASIKRVGISTYSNLSATKNVNFNNGWTGSTQDLTVKLTDIYGGVTKTNIPGESVSSSLIYKVWGPNSAALSAVNFGSTTSSIPIDTTKLVGAQYLEFDFFISDRQALVDHATRISQSLSLRMRFAAGSNNVDIHFWTQITKSGWNHVRLDISSSTQATLQTRLANDSIKNIRIFFEPNGASGTTRNPIQNFSFTLANIIAVKEETFEPSRPDTDAMYVYTCDDFGANGWNNDVRLDGQEKTEGIASAMNIFSNKPLENNAFINSSTTDIYLPGADILKFDLFVEDAERLDLAADMFVKMSSDPDGATDYVKWPLNTSTLENGWNSVSLSVRNAEEEGEIDWEAVKYFALGCESAAFTAGERLTMRLDNVRITAIVPFSYNLAGADSGPYASLVTKKVLYAKGDGSETLTGFSDGIPQRVFSSSNTANSGLNNLVIDRESGIDLTGCNVLTFNLHLNSQVAYDEWRSHLSIVIHNANINGGVSFPFPQDLTVPEGGGTFPVSIDISRLTEAQLTAVRRVAVSSFGNLQYNPDTNFGSGWTGSANDLTIKITDIFGGYTEKNTSGKLLTNGAYKFWGPGSEKLNDANITLLTNFDNLEGAKYLEFDFYVSDLEKFLANVQRVANRAPSYTMRFQYKDSANANVNIDFPITSFITRSGWTHIRLDVSGSVQSHLDTLFNLYFYMEPNAYSTTSPRNPDQNFVFGITNLIAVTEEMLEPSKSDENAKYLTVADSLYEGSWNEDIRLDGNEKTEGVSSAVNIFSDRDYKTNAFLYTLPFTMDFAGSETLKFDLYVSDIALLRQRADLHVLMSSVTGGDTDSAKWPLDLNELENGWNSITLSVSDAQISGNINWGKIIYFALSCESGASFESDETVTLRLDNVRLYGNMSIQVFTCESSGGETVQGKSGTVNYAPEQKTQGTHSLRKTFGAEVAAFPNVMGTVRPLNNPVDISKSNMLALDIYISPEEIDVYTRYWAGKMYVLIADADSDLLQPANTHSHAHLLPEDLHGGWNTVTIFIDDMSRYSGGANLTKIRALRIATHSQWNNNYGHAAGNLSAGDDATYLKDAIAAGLAQFTMYVDNVVAYFDPERAPEPTKPDTEARYIHSCDGLYTDGYWNEGTATNDKIKTEGLRSVEGLFSGAEDGLSYLRFVVRDPVALYGMTTLEFDLFVEDVAALRSETGLSVVLSSKVRGDDYLLKWPLNLNTLSNGWNTISLSAEGAEASKSTINMAAVLRFEVQATSALPEQLAVMMRVDNLRANGEFFDGYWPEEEEPEEIPGDGETPGNNTPGNNNTGNNGNTGNDGDTDNTGEEEDLGGDVKTGDTLNHASLLAIIALSIIIPCLLTGKKPRRKSRQ